MDLWGLTETDPTKRHALAGPSPIFNPFFPTPHTYVADVQLGLHAGPPTTGVEAVLYSVACL